MVTIANLRERYLAGETSPGRFVGEVFGRIRSEGERPVWISLVNENAAVERAMAVDTAAAISSIVGKPPMKS